MREKSDEISKLNRELQKNLNEMRSMFNLAPDAWFIAYDPECRQIRANPSGRKLLRLFDNEVPFHATPESKRPSYRIFQGDREVPAEELPNQVAAHGIEVHAAEYDIVFAAGDRITIIGNARPLYDDNGVIRGSIAVFFNITERKQAEERLRVTEERLRLATEGARIGPWDHDTVSGALVLEPSTRRILNVSQDEPMTFERFLSLVHPDDRARFSLAVEASKDPQGTGIYFSEYRIIWTDGSMRWLVARGQTYFEGEGPSRKAVRRAGIITDITDRKIMEEELRRSESRLAETNKNLEQQVAQRTQLLRNKERELETTRRLEGIGRLAGGVAHDFNNLLTGIVGVLREIRDELPDNDSRRDDLNMALQASESAFSLTRQLLAFSRRHIVTPHVLDLGASLAGFQKILVRLIGEDVRLHADFRPGIGNVLIDPGQLEQIVANLAVNARDAMPKGGDLFIEAAEHVQDEGSTGPPPPGHYMRFTLRDTGVGMSQETQDRIFEPFFTTKKNRGTGLGLSTVYGIVHQHGGHIRVRSQEGEGTTIDVFLPHAGTGQPEIPRQEKRKAVRNGHETVLVVEDDKLVRHVACNMLRRSGHNVLEASNGTEALALEEQAQERIQLLLTDVVMPGMNGRELAQALIRRRPGLAVLFMSGYTQDILDTKGIASGETNFIEKPNLSTDLLHKIREVLDRKK
jgi:signal transduction histidine kinase/ActR/RegA family two-component response regulator